MTRSILQAAQLRSPVLTAIGLDRLVYENPVYLTLHRIDVP